MDLILSGVLSLGSLVYFQRLARRSTQAGELWRAPLSPQDSLGVGDAIFAAILGLWFLAGILGSTDEEMVVNARLLIAGAVFSFLLITFVICFLVIRSINPIELFGLRRLPPAAVLSKALAGLAAALPATFFAQTLSFRLMGAEASPQPILQFLNQNPGWNDRLLLTFTALVVAPVSEELVFRGYLYGVIRRFVGRWWAVIISSMLFAAVHGHIPSLAGLFVLAVTLTLVYESSGSLWAPIAMHALFNGVTIALTLLWPDLMK